MKNIILILYLACATYTLNAQSDFIYHRNFFPISDDANIGLMNSISKEENILFEANPVARFNIYNDVFKKLSNGRIWAKAIYLSYPCQIRMFKNPDPSLPVKMPTYRILGGAQIMRRCTDPNDHSSQKFLSIAIEHGHYSNGQTKCAFNENIDDSQDPNSACMIYYRNNINSNTNLSQELNRKNGNFSTNLINFTLNFRSSVLEPKYFTPEESHSFSLGVVTYVDRLFGFDIGGYNSEDIKILGRHRIQFRYEYLRSLKADFIGIKEGAWAKYTFNYELINNPHKSVNRNRIVNTLSVFPFVENKEFGIFCSFIWGHDNYNYRVVDSGKQWFSGICWTFFPTFQLTQ